MPFRQPFNTTLRNAGLGLIAAALLSSGSAFAQVQLEKARSLIEQGRYQAAVAQIEQYLQENSQDPQARFLHALALARSGNQGRAIEVFSKLASDFPDLAEPRNNLGVLFAQMGEYEKARAALTEAVRIDPNHAPAQENLGDVHVALAKQAYAQAGQVEGDNRAVRAKTRYLNAMLDDAAKPVRQPPSATAGSGTPVAASAQASTSSGGVSMEDSGGAQNAAVLAAVRDWADAWSRQDLDAYLASYGEDFQPDGMRRSTWEKQRRQRVARPKFIRIDIDNVRVTPNEDGDMNVAFDQGYNADNYSDNERKILVLRNEGGDWKIVRETTLN